MHEVIINRHNHLIDPHLDAWGWEIAVYLFLGGLTAGLMVLSAMLLRQKGRHELSRWVRWLPFAAPVLISLGMLVLLLDLEQPSRVYRFYLAFVPSSPMSWGAWILLGVYPASIALGLTLLTEQEMTRLRDLRLLKATGLSRVLDWARSKVSSAPRPVATLNIVFGVALGLYTGVLLGTLQARELWNSTLLAPLFLVSGLSTGAAFMMLFPLKDGERHRLGTWDMLLIGTELSLLGLFLMDRATAGGHVADRFFGGDLTAVFWSFVVIMGLVLPFGLEVLERRRKLRPSVAAPVLILVGGLVLRWIFVFGGQISFA